ncbi:XkdX family protein [Lactobacillus apis]|uniref:XkdX family protein n=1 Tax=Lactobacillus apis TaxID=303541 RepID=UPI0016507DE2|nr:XkdX family protein [Lactobacillus apis]MBC6360587.1 XkdX family protein [Lactobacillus apis]
MNKAKIFEKLYSYLYSVGTYDKAKVASFVGKTIDAVAYNKITGDDYVETTQAAN